MERRPVEVMAGGDDGSAAAPGSVWAREVADGLAALDATQQLAIKLVYTHGLSQAEAAQWLSLTRATVADAIASGLQRLADQVAGRPRDTTPAGSEFPASAG